MTNELPALLDKYKKQGVEMTVEDSEYFEKSYNRLTNDYGVSPEDALRSVEATIKTRKGITSSLPGIPVDAGDLDIDTVENLATRAKMDAVAVRVKAVKLFVPNHPRMAQAGIIGDATGTCKFTTWKDKTNPEPFVEGTCYEIQWANKDEYNGRTQLNTTQAEVKPWNEDIVVKRTDRDTITGFTTKVLGAGLVNRCPVEKCRKPLTITAGGFFCIDHGIQENSIPDLRARVIVDQGDQAQIVYLSAQVLEGLTGFSVKDAEEIVRKQPVGGLFAIEKRLHDLIFGRALIAHTSPMTGQAFAQEAAFIKFHEAV